MESAQMKINLAATQAHLQIVQQLKINNEIFPATRSELGMFTATAPVWRQIRSIKKEQAGQLLSFPQNLCSSILVGFGMSGLRE
jgi:hypothetical protein